MGVLALAAAYYGSAKLGQSLRYTASVSAIWPPAGVGVAALYLWGLRWWPGVLIAELVINAELAVGSDPLPLGSLIGQQAGNMAEVLVGAILLRRLLGSGAALDRVEQVAGMFAALAKAYGGWAETVEKTGDFEPALGRALKKRGIRLLHLKTDVEQISNQTTIAELRRKA